MNTYHATHSVGPNFAFELLVRRLELNKVYKFDRSSLVFLMCVAKPIRSSTLKRFLELTQPFGLSQEEIAPGYGLAKNCIYVRSAYGEDKPILINSQGRACCGYINPNDKDVDIRIVDPEKSKEHEKPKKEGEVWVSSLSSGVGYWDMEELSETTFKNKLENHLGNQYLRTGDLGRVIEGKLFITRRIKDLIIVS
ncbi:hypothetical protein ACH5RR_021787 [Cinchona calisaya]|uniref:AMP-dependent synthetase/ligase domain-containing protein n=1 Tax=Cinchona calisaya TaxID=153742 RepID=A0ABD2ZN97_9GENT